MCPLLVADWQVLNIEISQISYPNLMIIKKAEFISMSIQILKIAVI
jgi:hypothetical protein